MVLNDAGRMVRDAWDRLPTRFPSLRLDAAAIMPNHVHGILIIEPAGSDRSCSLGDVAGAFKSTTTVEYSRGVKTQGWLPFRNALWQRNYFEHVIRDESERAAIREYTASNPAQWDQDQEDPGRR